MEFINHAEGYVEKKNNTYKYVYQYKDHLGNIRVSYDNSGSVSSPNASIVEEHNYYPFGLQQRGYNNANGTRGSDFANNYMFGGKELQDETFSGNTLDWYDISARNYDPVLGRWLNIDPLAEKMRRHSPYNYAFDNPIFFIDPDGRSPYPWPNPFAQLRGTYNAIANKVNNTIKSVKNSIVNTGEKIYRTVSNYDSSSLEGNESGVKAGGGVVFYAEKDYLQSGLAKPNEPLPGADIDYIDVTPIMQMKSLLGSELKAGSKTGDVAIDLAGLVESIVDVVDNIEDDSSTEALKSTDSDTTSFILQYWKDGIPMGGSGAGIGAGRKASEEAANREMKEDPYDLDLDSIQIIKMY